MLDDIIKKIDQTRQELDNSKRQVEIDRNQNISLILKEMSEELKLTWDINSLSVVPRGEGSFGLRCNSFDSYNNEVIKCQYDLKNSRWHNIACDLDSTMYLSNLNLKDLNKVEAISSVATIMALIYQGNNKIMSYLDRIRETFDKETSIKQSIEILTFMRVGTVQALKSERIVDAFVKGQAQLENKKTSWINGFSGQTVSCNKIQIRKNQSGTYTVDLIDDEGTVKSSSSRASEEAVTRLLENFYS